MQFVQLENVATKKHALSFHWVQYAGPKVENVIWMNTVVEMENTALIMCLFIMATLALEESHIVSKDNVRHIPANAVFCGGKLEKHLMISVSPTTMF